MCTRELDMQTQLPRSVIRSVTGGLPGWISTETASATFPLSKNRRLNEPAFKSPCSEGERPHGLATLLRRFTFSPKLIDLRP
jgi:hypothetical protein